MKAVLALALCALALVNAQDYTCDEVDTTIVKFYGNNLKCPDGLICNNIHKTIGAGKAKPCIAASNICEYTCNDKNETQVIINTVPFQCQPGKQCNSKKLTCEVCLAKPCDANAFKCVDGTNTFVMAGSDFKYSCPETTTCNKNYEQPCSACINTIAGPSTLAPLSRSARNIYFKPNFK